MFELVVVVIFVAIMVLLVEKVVSVRVSSARQNIPLFEVDNERLTELYHQNPTKFNEVVKQIEKEGFKVIECGNSTDVKFCIVWQS